MNLKEGKACRKLINVFRADNARAGMLKAIEGKFKFFQKKGKGYIEVTYKSDTK